jgi:hypothetical protein
VAGSVQLAKDGKLIRVHPIRHDRSRELDAFANLKAGPPQETPPSAMSARSCLKVSFPTAWPTALPGCPDRVGPEIISPVLASSGTIAGLFSLLGAHEVRVWSPRLALAVPFGPTSAVPRLRAGFVNGMSYQ